MNHKISVVMPVRNVLGLTQAALASIKTHHDYEVIIIDDHSNADMKSWLAGQDRIMTLTDPPTSGVAANWNLGTRLALDHGAEFVLIANNDVLFHPQTIDNLVTRMLQGDVVMATGGNFASNFATPELIFDYPIDYPATEDEHPDFSMMMISRATIEQIGWFDENFMGAYFEDNDYHARIALSNQKAVKIGHAPYYHYASQTLVQNMGLQGLIASNQQQNQHYFYRKWGHAPVGDVPVMREVYFKHPFNDPTKSIKDWA